MIQTTARMHEMIGIIGHRIGCLQNRLWWCTAMRTTVT